MSANIAQVDWDNWNAEIAAAITTLTDRCGPFGPEWKHCETATESRRYEGWFRIDDDGNLSAAQVAVYDNAGLAAKAFGPLDSSQL